MKKVLMLAAAISATGFAAMAQDHSDAAPTPLARDLPAKPKIENSFVEDKEPSLARQADFAEAMQKVEMRVTIVRETGLIGRSQVMEEVIQGSTHGIDLHAGSNHRANLPQIRADVADIVLNATTTSEIDALSLPASLPIFSGLAEPPRSPLQPAKLHPASGVAVRVTTSP